MAWLQRQHADSLQRGEARDGAQDGVSQSASHRASHLELATLAPLVSGTSDWPVGWQGACIWAGAPPIPTPPISFELGIPPTATWFRACYLRATFSLSAIPTTVPARATADGRCILYVNGVEVTRGPARSAPERLTWLEVDLAPYLHPGENVIGALVWYYGRPMAWWAPSLPAFQLGYGMFACEAPAIGVATGADWQGRAAPYHAILPGLDNLNQWIAAPPELIDGRAIPQGWSAPGFDASAWAPATVLQGGFVSNFSERLPVAPFTAPEPTGIAPLTAIPVALTLRERRWLAPLSGDDPVALYDAAETLPPTSTALTNAQPLAIYDAGRMTTATPWIEARGEAGSVVDVYVGEDLRADGMVEIKQRMYALRCVLGGDGVERFEGLHPVGFRYLAVIARDGAAALSVGATERRYPRDETLASFTCDDEALNHIWQVGARTLDLCSLDAFIDCPGREQRAWVGDAYIHALLTYSTSADWRLARRYLRLSAQGRRRDGLLGMVAGGDFGMGAPTIPDYSLHWLRALARYVEYSGDLATARDLLPTAAGVVATFEGYRERDGFLHHVPNWIFIDWAMTERAEIIGALDALYALALTDYAWLLETTTGDTTGAAEAREQVARTRTAFAQLWDARRGVYVDAADAVGPRRRVSQHTNALAILAGCAPRERWPGMLDYILDETRLTLTPMAELGPMASAAQSADPADYLPFDPERQVVATQPFFAHFVHQAVAAAGQQARIPALCRRWAAQLARGNTTFEEFWDAPVGVASRTHAWSATPTYDLTTHVLGVRPLAPGYTRAAIQPYFGALTRLAGRVPTPQGFIELDLTRTGGTLTLPPGVSAEVTFPDGQLVGGVFGPGSHQLGAPTVGDTL